MQHKVFNAFIDEQGICWISDGDRMLQVSPDLFVRHSYRAFHERGFPTTREGKRRAEEATAKTLFAVFDRSGDGEQVA